MDTQAKKILSGVWASGDDAERESPEDAGIDREEGWGLPYEQPGSGALPEREVWNQRWRELDGAFAEEMRYGVPRWDAGVDYAQGAFANVDGVLRVALAPTGPATGNPTDPESPGQQVWRIY